MFEQFPKIYLLRRVVWCWFRWVKFMYVGGVEQRHPKPL